MSKVLKQYEELKKTNDNCIYIFKIGIFYNTFNIDAEIMNKLFNLKITTQGNNLIKCGFPLSKIDYYTEKLQDKNIEFKIIEDYDLKKSEEINNIIYEILHINLLETSSKEAFDILYNFQERLKT